MKYLHRNKTTNVIDFVFDINTVQPSPAHDILVVSGTQFRNNMVGSIYINENNYKPRRDELDSEGQAFWTSDGTNWVDSRSDDEVWTMVKLRRNIELLESDWTQLDDAPLTPPEKARWNGYRRELRDVPNGNPTNPRAAENVLKDLRNSGGAHPDRKPPTDRESTFPLMARASRTIL